jgi:hypothetical protein
MRDWPVTKYTVAFAYKAMPGAAASFDTSN